MADQARKTSQPPLPPAIRTMRSDIAEFLKTKKPSLLSLLARQVEKPAQTRRTPSPGEWLKIIAPVLLLGAGTIGFLLLFYKSSPGQPSSSLPALAIPPPFIFFEQTLETTIGKSRKEFLEALRQASHTTAATGSFRRIILRVRNDTPTPTVIGIQDFFDLAGIQAESALRDTLRSPPQPFLYQEGERPLMGVLLETKSPTRTLAALHAAEASLAQAWSVLFLGLPPPPRFEPYQDFTYRNIDFRYLMLDPERKRGMGYASFPAKNLFVIATSQEMLRQSINRLLGNH